MESDQEKYKETIELVSVEDSETQSFLHHVEGEDEEANIASLDAAEGGSNDDDLALPKPSASSTGRKKKRVRRNGPINAPVEEEDDEEWGEEDDDDEGGLSLEDHAQMVLAILKPVAVTMLLVIWVVKTITIPYGQNLSPVYMVYQEVASDDTSTKLFGALLNALMFVVVIVLVTVLFVILYKYRCLKVIYVWLIGSSGMMLLMFGSIIFTFMWKAYNLPMDWITFVFIMWNFSGVGVIAIFWHAPQRVNQAYLVLISAFMAIFFTRLPEWTTWSILAAVALYDVFAVLCPRGPLRVLVETAQQRQEPIPALLYNGFVVPLLVNTLNMMGSSDRGEGLLEEDKKPQSVKLGLGDFVFYSVLVGRAALFNWLTVFTCFIAIITGLFWTLLLLAVFRKALPALPFSIALGIFFFFLSKVFLLPFVMALGSSAVFV
jgi:hypothetical protein